MATPYKERSTWNNASVPAHASRSSHERADSPKPTEHQAQDQRGRGDGTGRATCAISPEAALAPSRVARVATGRRRPARPAVCGAGYDRGTGANRRRLAHVGRGARQRIALAKPMNMKVDIAADDGAMREAVRVWRALPVDARTALASALGIVEVPQEQERPRIHAVAIGAKVAIATGNKPTGDSWTAFRLAMPQGAYWSQSEGLWTGNAQLMAGALQLLKGQGWPIAVHPTMEALRAAMAKEAQERPCVLRVRRAKRTVEVGVGKAAAPSTTVDLAAMLGDGADTEDDGTPP